MNNRNLLLVAFAGAGALAAAFAGAGQEQPAASRTEHAAKHAPLDPLATGPATAGRLPVDHAAKTPARSRPAPPAERRAPSAPPSTDADADVIGSTDPTSRAYDPITLIRATNATPSEILDREPRDPAFAGPREAALRDRITERLRRRVGLGARVDANCRTSSCEITVHSASDGGDPTAALAELDLDQLAEAAQVGPMDVPRDSRVRGTRIIVVYSAVLRDHAAYEQQLRQHEANDEPSPTVP